MGCLEGLELGHIPLGDKWDRALNFESRGLDSSHCPANSSHVPLGKWPFLDVRTSICQMGTWAGWGWG